MIIFDNFYLISFTKKPKRRILKPVAKEIELTLKPGWVGGLFCQIKL